MNFESPHSAGLPLDKLAAKLTSYLLEKGIDAEVYYTQPYARPLGITTKIEVPIKMWKYVIRRGIEEIGRDYAVDFKTERLDNITLQVQATIKRRE